MNAVVGPIFLNTNSDIKEMPRDRDRDRDHSLSHASPFFLSKVNNKVLTEIKTRLMFPTVYMCFRVVVNRKIGDILPLFLPYFLRYTILFQYLRRERLIISNSHISALDDNMSGVGFSDQEIHRYTKLISCNDPYEKITFCTKELSTFLRLKKRQTRDFLKKCEDFSFLKRYYNTSNTGKRKIGNSLHLELTPPLLRTEKEVKAAAQCLTFTGVVVKKVESVYRGRKIVDFELKDVRNDTGNITFEKYWIEETHIVSGDTDLVRFKANLKIIADSRLILVPVINQLHG